MMSRWNYRPKQKIGKCKRAERNIGFSPLIPAKQVHRQESLFISLIDSHTVSYGNNPLYLLAAPSPFISNVHSCENRLAASSIRQRSAVFLQPSLYSFDREQTGQPHTDTLTRRLPVLRQSKSPAKATLWVGRTAYPLVPFPPCRRITCFLCLMFFPASCRNNPPLRCLSGEQVLPVRNPPRAVWPRLFATVSYRSHHHYSAAKLVCRRERPCGLDQWRTA